MPATTTTKADSEDVFPLAMDHHQHLGQTSIGQEQQKSQTRGSSALVDGENSTG